MKAILINARSGTVTEVEYDGLFQSISKWIAGFDIFKMKGTLLTWDCSLGEQPNKTNRKFTDDTLRRLRPIVEMRAE